MYEDQYTLHVLKIMTSSLYTLRYDEGKVTRSYHNEINEALCGKILKTYPAKHNSIQNIPYWMAIGHIDAVFYEEWLHMNCDTAKPRYKIM